MSTPVQGVVEIPPNNTLTGANPVCVYQATWNGVPNSNMEGVALVDPSTLLPASITTPGGAATNVLAIQGAAGGVAVPVSLSVPVVTSTSEQSISSGGTQRTMSTLSSATQSTPLYIKASPGRVCKIWNTSQNPAVQPVTIIDQASGASNASNIIFSGILPAGGSPPLDLQCACVNGIGIWATGALASNIVVTWS
jgi:hypothetical protein